MPVYEYECATCGTFADFRTIDDRDRPAPCEICDLPAMRVISAPHLAVMHPLQRMAAVRNERSRHEPRVGLKTSCCSGPSCTHRRARNSNPEKPALRASARRNRRPWMLGH